MDGHIMIAKQSIVWMLWCCCWCWVLLCCCCCWDGQKGANERRERERRRKRYFIVDARYDIPVHKRHARFSMPRDTRTRKLSSTSRAPDHETGFGHAHVDKSKGETRRNKTKRWQAEARSWDPAASSCFSASAVDNETKEDAHEHFQQQPTASSLASDRVCLPLVEIGVIDRCQLVLIRRRFLGARGCCSCCLEQIMTRKWWSIVSKNKPLKLENHLPSCQVLRIPS